MNRLNFIGLVFSAALAGRTVCDSVPPSMVSIVMFPGGEFIFFTGPLVYFRGKIDLERETERIRIWSIVNRENGRLVADEKMYCDFRGQRYEVDKIICYNDEVEMNKAGVFSTEPTYICLPGCGFYHDPVFWRPVGMPARSLHKTTT